MKTSIKQITIACTLALFGSTAFAAPGISSNTYNAAKEQIQSAYKVERENCGSLTANAKDVCQEAVKGGESVALAHLQWQRTATVADQRKLSDARVEARYAVAKEKCDDVSGNAKSTCTTEAKTRHDKAKADLKMNKEVAEARSDAEETKHKADYKLASERCDTMTGGAKDSCTATAKARFGM